MAETEPAPAAKPKAAKKKKLDKGLAGAIKNPKTKKKLKKAPKKKKGAKKGSGKTFLKGLGRANKYKDPDDKKEALEHFGDIVATSSYKEQMVFFMNATWADNGEKKKCEEMYTWCLKMEELGEIAKNSKHDLDDFQAARFLETFGKTMTVIERRQQLRDIDIDGNNRMGMLEWLVYNYTTDVIQLMNAPQGTNAALKSAEKALKVVLKEIKKIEDEKKKLNKLIKSGKGLAAIRGKAELAQLLDKDPLPLNKALITAEAAVRKAQKSKDMTAQGKAWLLSYELAQAKKYKPKGGISKGRFSVSS